ncbi:MAG TPA: hypothetical protein VF545_12880, partial [Thermoleophilaceae bacterium]
RSGNGPRLRSDARPRRWILRIRSPRKIRYRLQASFAAMDRPLRPCAVRLGKRALKRKSWRYDRRSGVLIARFSARRGAKLTVSGRCRKR